MNRTTLLKLGYLLALAALGFAAWALIDRHGRRMALPLLLVLLVPGRVQGVILRDLFTGRQLLDQGHPSKAIEPLERMAEALRSAPWKRKSLWLGWSVYTVDALAMTLNNLGAAHQRSGDRDAARRAFDEARTIDNRYALPHLGLAGLAAMEGDRAATEAHRARAVALGFRGSSVDQLIREAQTVLAAVEGRPNSGT